jgi:transaldolase
MNPLLALNQCGQSVWLDNLSRQLITGRRLQRLIDEDGLGGVTSNPTIFDKAIAGSTDYDAGIRRALDADRNINNRALAERLIVEDIQLAADVLRPVYHHSDGANGSSASKSRQAPPTTPEQPSPRLGISGRW